MRLTILLIFAGGSVARAQSAGTVYQQGGAPDYVVSVEAENFAGQIPGAADPDAHLWVPELGFAAYSGAGALRSLPDVLVASGGGPPQDTGYSLNSPRLDFRVNFVTSGQHFVWVRGTAPVGATDDSVHVGLNGQEVPSADRISGWGTYGGSGYQWVNNTMDPGVGAVLGVPTPGVHTINVWMREDGFVFDKLVVTPDATYVPSAAGPPESALVPDPGAPGGGPPLVAAGGGRENDNGDGGLNDACGLMGLEVLLLLALAKSRGSVLRRFLA
jgi:hypothetical protein